MNNNSVNRGGARPKKSKKIQILSAACLSCIILGVASIGVEIADLVISGSYSRYDVYIGLGIWVGALFLSAGCFGIATTYTRTRLRFIGTVLMSAFAIVASVRAITVSGRLAYNAVKDEECSRYSSGSDQETLCHSWIVLQWCLMSIGLLGFISSIIVLIIASEAICCINYANIESTSRNAVMNQQEVNVGIQHAQQQHGNRIMPQQPMQLNVQQLPTFQVSYAPQLMQIQQQQPQQQQGSATAPALHHTLQLPQH